MQRLAIRLLIALPLLSGCGSPSVPPGNSNTTAVTTIGDSTGQDSTATIAPTGGTVVQFDMKAVKALVPPGCSLVEAEAGPVLEMGELNGDGNLDVVFLVESPGAERPWCAAIVGYGEENGGFHMGGKTGNLGPEPLMEPDPEMFAIQGEVLTLSYQSLRWGIDLKFKLDRSYGDLRLIGTESISDGDANGDGAGGSTADFRTGVRVSRYKKWDAEQGEVWLPETREQVSTDLLPLAGFNDNMIYDLQ